MDFGVAEDRVRVLSITTDAAYRASASQAKTAKRESWSASIPHSAVIVAKYVDDGGIGGIEACTPVTGACHVESATGSAIRRPIRPMSAPEPPAA